MGSKCWFTRLICAETGQRSDWEAPNQRCTHLLLDIMAMQYLTNERRNRVERQQIEPSCTTPVLDPRSGNDVSSSRTSSRPRHANVGCPWSESIDVGLRRHLRGDGTLNGESLTGGSGSDGEQDGEEVVEVSESLARAKFEHEDVERVRAKVHVVGNGVNGEAVDRNEGHELAPSNAELWGALTFSSTQPSEGSRPRGSMP
jgi:hypothetical protein